MLKKEISKDIYILCEHENICFTSLESVSPCNSHGRTESVYVYLSMLLTQLPTHDTLQEENATLIYLHQTKKLTFLKKFKRVQSCEM